MSRLAPPVLERSTRRAVLVAFLAGGGACAAASVLDGPWDVLLFMIGMVVFMTVTGWHALLWHRSRAFVAAHDYLLCEACGYPLDHGGVEGVCPECGAPYRRERLRAYWRQRLHPRDPDEHSSP